MLDKEYVCLNCGKNFTLDDAYHGSCDRCHSMDISEVPQAVFKEEPLSLETPEDLTFVQYTDDHADEEKVLKLLKEAFDPMKVDMRYPSEQPQVAQIGYLRCEKCRLRYHTTHKWCTNCGYPNPDHEGPEDNSDVEPVEKKYDQGKPMVGLMKKDFAKALLAVADVTTYGVEKYKAPGSWRYVENARDRYEDAHGRHDFQSTYEDFDEESGRLHLVHRAWNALACLELFLELEYGETYEEV